MNKDVDNNDNIVNITGTTNEIKPMQGISFSANNNNNKKPIQSSLSKRKEPEKVEPENYITTLEGTKISTLRNETTSLGDKVKVIPLAEQLNRNYEKSDKIISSVQKEEKEKEKEQENNKKLKTETTTTTTTEKQSFYKSTQTGLQLNPNRKQDIKSIVDTNTDEDNIRNGSNSTIPLIMKLKGIDKYENEDEKFKYDVESRPDQCDQDDYNETPVGIFGEAMLRGMGWEPGKSIGSSNKGLTEPIEYIKRPGFRLGLGAKPLDDALELSKMGGNVGPVEGPDGKVRHIKGIDEKLISSVKKIDIGSHITVIHGQHKGMNAKVLSIDQKSDKVQIIFKSDEKAYVYKSDIKLYESKSSGNGSGKSSGSNGNSSKSSNSSSNSNNSSSSSSSSVIWIRPQILVKVISKTLGDGKFYNKKATIVDILGEKICSLHFDNGVVIENVKQNMLETAIPKVKGDLIIVRGKSKGKIGQLIERRKKKDTEMAVVQLVGDLSVSEFDLDDICEYVGTKDIDLYN